MQFNKILKIISQKHPEITLKEAKNFYWSPVENSVFYNPHHDNNEGVWALLHESGHALLNHTHYLSDVELVSMEVEAWGKAREISNEIGIDIDEEHVQDCLDSYRDWIYKRSLCPKCSLCGIQINNRIYSCIFCNDSWSVSSERFCRPYRLSSKHR